jgi:hypothetical protein
VTNESTDSFQVTCQPGFNGGLPQHFTLTVYKMSPENGDLNLSANLSSAMASFTVSGLDPGSKYVGELVGHNVKGMGVPTQIHVYTLKLPEKLIPQMEDGLTSGKPYFYHYLSCRVYLFLSFKMHFYLHPVTVTVTVILLPSFWNLLLTKGYFPRNEKKLGPQFGTSTTTGFITS